MYKYAHAFILGLVALRDAQMERERIDESTLIMTVARMDDHACRLVHHQHVVILEHYVEGDILRNDLKAAAAVRHDEAYHVFRPDDIVGLYDLAVHLDILFLDGALDAVSRSVLHV